jgi:hypothetical protein
MSARKRFRRAIAAAAIAAVPAVGIGAFAAAPAAHAQVIPVSGFGFNPFFANDGFSPFDFFGNGFLPTTSNSVTFVPTVPTTSTFVPSTSNFFNAGAFPFGGLGGPGFVFAPDNSTTEIDNSGTGNTAAVLDDSSAARDSVVDSGFAFPFDF